jgi:actin related protein 2/3 complex subunit 1A/1B
MQLVFLRLETPLLLPVRSTPPLVVIKSSDPFIGHDSSITIVYPSGQAICTIRSPSLPLVTLAWTSEESIVAAGHDCKPLVYAGSEQGWQEVGTLDDSSSSRASEGSRSGFGSSGSVGRLKTGAFATFRDADSRGQSSLSGAASGSSDTKLNTIHQNTITSVRSYDVQGGYATKVSTSGVDGTLVIWDTNEVSALAGKMGGVRI